MATIITVGIYSNNGAHAQSNFTSSMSSSGKTLHAIPAQRSPNINPTNNQTPAASNNPTNNQTPAASNNPTNNQTPAASNGTAVAPSVTAPPRPTIIAPSNHTASSITSEIEAGNARRLPPTNGSMFLGTPG
jgi:hypothetical protein